MIPVESVRALVPRSVAQVSDSAGGKGLIHLEGTEARTNSISAPAADAVLEDARRSRFVARDEEGSGSLAPHSFDGNVNLAGDPLEKLSQLYSQAPYTFRLSSDRSLPILYADESHCLPSSWYSPFPFSRFG